MSIFQMAAILKFENIAENMAAILEKETVILKLAAILKSGNRPVTISVH